MRLSFATSLTMGFFLVACGDGASPTQSNPQPDATSASSAVGTGGAGQGGATSTSSSGEGGAGGGQGGASTTTSTTATTTAATTTTTTGAGGGNPDGPELMQLGQSDRILLQGVIVTPDQAFEGEVLVVGDAIACVAVSCAADPQAANASIVKTNGMVFPGLIDTHNHILFDIFDEDDWSPTQTYTNHDQWPNDAKYSAMVDAKQYLNKEQGSVIDRGCELNKYGELKGLIAGTTSIAGSANPSNKKCFASLTRTIDQTSNDLPSDKVQMATIFPQASSANGVCANFTSDKTDAYLIHIAEGVDQTALDEFADLGTVTATQGCLYAPETTIIHGTALGDPEMTIMANAGMSLTWSPRSNVFLYGAGTDLSMTTDIPLALSKGILVALAPDWSIGGSQNLLDELRFADLVDNTIWGDILSPQDLTKMVTKNAAKILGLEATLGSIAVGLKADLTVVSGDVNFPYDALLAATPGQIALVMVGGVPLYGDVVLQPLGPATPGCEALDACGVSKFVCVAETSSSDKLNQTLAEIENALSTDLAAYDALNLTAWDFSPIAPLVKCP